jgi:hypothetical protein
MNGKNNHVYVFFFKNDIRAFATVIVNSNFSVLCFFFYLLKKKKSILTNSLVKYIYASRVIIKPFQLGPL